jgi:hypothetical protein
METEMKKLVLTLVLLSSTLAMAHNRGHVGGHWQRGGHSWTWVVPAVVAGAIVYRAVEPPAPRVVYQAPPPPAPSHGQCSPWTEYQNPDGSVTRTRTCY